MADDTLVLNDLELLQWLARWGRWRRGWSCPARVRLENFYGQVAELTPHLENGDKELSFTHRVSLPGRGNSSDEHRLCNFFPGGCRSH